MIDENDIKSNTPYNWYNCTKTGCDTTCQGVVALDKILFHEYVYENVICEVSAIQFWHQFDT